ncbi:hypothetical protein OBCHQ24_14155 [Oceanobacillus iheyensis]|nr:hypothetical protein OBCHQ24_14155 [Oceanobacillus iheyensis]
METNEILQQILDKQVETNKKIEALEANMEGRFAQVEERFAQMEKRFVLVEGRLDKVEEKIELLTSQTTQAYHDLVEIITNQKEDITQNFTPLVETAFWADKTLHLEKEIYKLKQQHS